MSRDQYAEVPDTLEAQCEARGLPVSAAILARHERGNGLTIGGADAYVEVLKERARAEKAEERVAALRGTIASNRDRLSAVAQAPEPAWIASVAALDLAEALAADTVKARETDVEADAGDESGLSQRDRHPHLQVIGIGEPVWRGLNRRWEAVVSYRLRPIGETEAPSDPEVETTRTVRAGSRRSLRAALPEMGRIVADFRRFAPPEKEPVPLLEVIGHGEPVRLGFARWEAKTTELQLHRAGDGYGSGIQHSIFRARTRWGLLRKMRQEPVGFIHYDRNLTEEERERLTAKAQSQG